MSTLKTCSFDSASISRNPAVTWLPSMSPVRILCACLTVCFITATEINRMFTLDLSESLICMSVTISFPILSLPLRKIIKSCFSCSSCMTLEMTAFACRQVPNIDPG